MNLPIALSIKRLKVKNIAESGRLPLSLLPYVASFSRIYVEEPLDGFVDFIVKHRRDGVLCLYGSNEL